MAQKVCIFLGHRRRAAQASAAGSYYRVSTQKEGQSGLGVSSDRGYHLNSGLRPPILVLACRQTSPSAPSRKAALTRQSSAPRPVSRRHPEPLVVSHPSAGDRQRFNKSPRHPCAGGKIAGGHSRTCLTWTDKLCCILQSGSAVQIIAGPQPPKNLRALHTPRVCRILRPCLNRLSPRIRPPPQEPSGLRVQSAEVRDDAK